MKQMTTEGDSFPKMTRPVYLFLTAVFLPYFFFLFLEKKMLLSALPNQLQNGESFLTLGSVTKNSNMFTVLETPWFYL